MNVRFLAVLALAALSTAAFAQSDVEVATVIASPGETVSVPVTLTAPGNVSAVQFEISYDPVALTIGAAVAGNSLLLTGHQAEAEIVSPGLLRALVQSGANASLFGGEVVRVPFTVPEETDVGFQPLTLSAVLLGDVNGIAVTTGGITSGGIDVIPFPCPDGLVFDLEVTDETVTGPLVFGACRMLVVGPGVTVESGGELLLQSGLKVEFRDGLAVEEGGSLTVVIGDPFDFE